MRYMDILNLSIMNNIRMFIMAAAATAAAVTAYAQAPGQNSAKAPEYEFTVVKEVPVTSIKNQFRSGTCWCFSALSFVESEILRTKGISDIDLSEMFVVGKSYHDRAVKYVRLDGKLGFSAGSSFGDVFHVIKDYGIVPQCEMEGLNYGTDKPEHSEMDAVLAAYVEAVAKKPNRTLTPAWIKGFDGVVAAYLGEYPELFTYNGVSYTPESFRDYLGIDTDDYVNLTSFTHHPFYEPFVIEVCDNWRWDTAYNLPIDEFMDVMYNAIDKGYSIAWGSDVSEAGFTRNGLATVPDVDEKPGAGSDQEHWVGKDETAKVRQPASSSEKKITQEMRQIAYDNKQTTDDHGMHIYGIAKDQNGNSFFIVKNSWGDAGNYNGVWYASDAFVRYKTLNIVVHKDALPKNIRKKLGIK